MLHLAVLAVLVVAPADIRVTDAQTIACCPPGALCPRPDPPECYSSESQTGYHTTSLVVGAVDAASIVLNTTHNNVSPLVTSALGVVAGGASVAIGSANMDDASRRTLAIANVAVGVAAIGFAMHGLGREPAVRFVPWVGPARNAGLAFHASF